MHAPAGIIEPDLLMLAYRSGIFPMSDARNDGEVFWVEPRRRAVLPLDGFHLARSLAKVLKKDRFRVTCNAAFGEVMLACAAPRDEDGDTWISHRIEASYRRLHELGHAHSIECWLPNVDGTERLVGGLYGVGFDRVFCGESMFSRATDASKVALAWLVAVLRRAGATLLDCQFITSHLASMGAVEITQNRYLKLLKAAQAGYNSNQVTGGFGLPEGFGEGLAAGVDEGSDLALSLPKAFGALLAEAEASSSSPGNFIAQSLIHTS